MIKQVIIFLLIVSFSVFLTGCSDIIGVQSGGSSSGSSSGAAKTVSSTNALVMSFSNVASVIYENDGLNIDVNLKNIGGQDISGGKLFLTGYDQEYIQITNDRVDFAQGASFDLLGVSEYNPIAIEDTLMFYDRHVKMPENVDSFTQIFKATACYPYTTKVQAQVCIDNDYRSNIRKTCDYRNVQVGAQSGPVQVTSIEENMFEDRVQFKVFITNRGNGDVIDKNAYSRCPFDLNEVQDIDRVFVVNPQVSKYSLNCVPVNPIVLKGNQGYFLCSYEGDLGQESYMTVLTMELQYAYRTSMSTQVQILKTP